jgi:ribosome-binding factor A
MMSSFYNQFRRLAHRTLLPPHSMSSQRRQHITILCQSFSSHQSQSDDQVVFIDGKQITDEQQSPSVNIRLEAIKTAGMTQLHNQTQDVISRTRQPLFDDVDLVDVYGNKKPSIAQIQEASRIEGAVHDALASYASRYDTFNVKGQVIDVLGVEISPDLKQARVYWCLPRVLDLKGLSSSKLEQVVRRMQKILDERGGKIQGIVHSRLRAYYPPKLKWVAAEHVSKDLKRGVSLEKGKKKWI